jgi:hypothetical protein
MLSSKGRILRVLPIVGAAAALAALALTACGSSGDDEDTAQPVEQRVAGVAAKCDPLLQTESYRYTISFQLRAADGETSPTATDSDGTAPLSDFAAALTTLLSDFTLEGAYRAPDRSQAILRFQNEELELREVGEESWLRIGTTWQEEDLAETALLTPVLVCREIVAEIAPSLGARKLEGQRVNGIVTDHYRLDETDIADLPDVLATGHPDRYTLDLWLAQEGSWPVRLHIQSTEMDETGQPVGFRLTMDIRDVNDPGITIEPPVIGAR